MINDLNQLSEREREILRLVASGLSNQQIANQLGISINTVKVHLRNVFGKIGVASRTEATMYAVRSGIVQVERAHTAPPTLVEELEPPVVEPRPAVIEPEPQTLPPIEPEPELVQPVERTTVPSTELDDEPVAEATIESAPSAPKTTPVPQPRLSPLRNPVIGVVAGVLLLIVIGVIVWEFGWPGSARDATLSDGQAATDDGARWKELPDMPIPRAGFAAANVGDAIYVIGGENGSGVLNNGGQYDPGTGKWTEIRAKPTPVTDVRSVVLGGKLYVPGGRTSSDPKAVTSVVERYDPRTNTWEKVASLPAPRSAYALAALEGKLYLFGGWDGTNYHNEVFEYDPDQDQWQPRSPVPTARAFADAVVVDGGIYVLGGEDKLGQLSANEVYTPAQEGTQPWSRRAALPKPRSRFSSAEALSVIHVIGGIPASDPPLKYNTRTDQWEEFAAGPKPSGERLRGIVLDGVFVTLGGQLDAQTYSPTVEGYQALYTISAPFTPGK